MFKSLRSEIIFALAKLIDVPFGKNAIFDYIDSMLKIKKKKKRERIQKNEIKYRLIHMENRTEKKGTTHRITVIVVVRRPLHGNALLSLASG